MTNNPNSINSIESNVDSSKSSRFLENTKRAVRNVLVKTGIAASTMTPMATTTTSTVIPASVNTITAIAPLASTTIKTISLGTAAGLLAACSKDDPDGPINTKDTIAPTINVSKSEIDITGGKQVRIDGNQLYIGDVLVASRTDNISKNCNVTLSLNGKSITSGNTVSEEGTLNIKVSDESGNSKSIDIKLNITKNAPSITVNQYEVNILGGVKVNINNNQLLLGDEIIASRDDENLESCKVTLSFNGQEISSGTSINEAGKLTLTITNKNKKSATAEITITNDLINGLENLRQAQLQVDKEINLLNGITLADGIELAKTEIELEGQRNNITDPSHYTPEYPGTCNIIFTIKLKNGNTSEVRVDNLTIKALEYKSLEIVNINPEDLMPKVEVGDKNIYKHIEHLRIPESTVITDMMWKYGAGNHSPEEYQQLMMRLNTGMMRENPIGYSNYEIVGGELGNQPSNHAHSEWFTLNMIIRHANFIVIDNSSNREYLYNLCKNNPNKINIMGLSKGGDVTRAEYDRRPIDIIKQYDREKNYLVFCAGGNIRENGGILKNKIYQEDYNLPDEHSVYSERSRAHNKNDNTLDRHLMITFGTDKDGDIDQTGEIVESSKFPVGFHNKVLFSGRELPHRKDAEDKIRAATGKYATSHTNYVNVAIADLCFQMKADIADVDELLEMIRSTALTDHIRFNGEDQPLQLMNPAGFFQKYLMPTGLPNNLKSDKTVPLNKGYYKGVIFDIPGSEVKINGQWVTYNDTNKSQIKNQNPMTLEWRLNGDLCRKLGYKGQTIQGKVIVVNDKWNGLNIDKEFSVNIQ